MLFSVGKLDHDRISVVGDDILDGRVEQITNARLVFSGLVEDGSSEVDAVSESFTGFVYRPKIETGEYRP